MRGWARPRRTVRGSDMDHASHSILAMCSAEVRIIAAAIKSVLIHRPAIGKNSSVAVRIIRGTKLSVGNAGSAAGDTVAATDPRPSYCVACADADFVRNKREALPDGHIENLAGTRLHAVRHWLPVWVDNPEEPGSVLFFCCDSEAVVI